MVKRKYVTILLCTIVCAIGLWLLITKCVQGYYDEELKRDLRNSTVTSVNLPDQLIEDAVLERIHEKYIRNGRLSDMLGEMTEVERNVFVTCYFERKVNSGGLCSFLLDYAELGPYILDALDAVKAEPYRELLENFTDQNHIDLQHINEDKIFDGYDYFSFYGQYPFNMFDTGYQQLEQTEQQNMSDYIADYIYENMVSL